MAESSARHRLVHRGLAGMLSEMATRSGGSAVEVDGVLLYASAVPGPTVWNGALLLDETVPPADAIAVADDHFAGLRRGYTFFAYDQLHPALVDALDAADRRPQLAPQMVCTSPPEIPMRDGIQLAVVETERGRRAFLAVAGPAFGSLGESPTTWGRMYPSVEALSDDGVVATVIASGEDGPGAAGMVYVHDGVATLIHIGTQPRFRRQGLGELVARRLTALGFDMGATVASLQSTPMGVHAYEAAGFVRDGAYRLAVRSDS